MPTKRVSMSIDLEVLNDVDSVCSRLSVTRSVLMTELLRDSIVPLKALMDVAFPKSDGVRARDPKLVRDFLAQFTQDSINELQTQISDWDEAHGNH